VGAEGLSAPRPRLLARAPARVRIVEVGPRDGLQNEPRTVPAAEKAAFVEALADAGHSHIEVTSFVSPRKVPQLADAEEVFRAVRKREGVTYTALVPNATGLRRALSAGCRSIAVFTAASETFNRKNIGASIDESIEEIRRVAEEAFREGLRVRAYISMAFVCPYEGRIAPGRVADIAGRLRDVGIRSISLGDTLGAAYPDQVAGLLETLGGRFGLDGFALHLHDTHRRALANALAGLLLGIEELDASAGGLGGCPFAPGAKGNVATEDVVDFLGGMGIATGIDAARVRAAAEAVRRTLGS
jgi:isopropylmalate/homocitrate/citramalate synthase